MRSPNWGRDAFISGQVVDFVLGYFQNWFLFGCGFFRRNRTPPPGRGLLIAAAFFEDAQQSRVKPVGDQWLHVLSRKLGSAAVAEVGKDGVRDLAVTDGVLTFAQRLPQGVNFLLPDFGLRQSLAFERLDARLIK